MKIIIKNWVKVIFILSLIAILSALIAEYVFNLIPCKMCLYQRHPYYFIIGILIIFFFLKKTNSIWLYILVELAILYGIFYSAWHVGIEQNLLKGPSGCSATLNNVGSIENLKEQISNQDIVNCSDISWIIFGLSAATINLLLLILLLFFNTLFIYKALYDKEKNI